MNKNNGRPPSKAALLQKAYRINGNHPIAYVDESYFDHDLHIASGKISDPFYVVGSVVVKASERELLNKHLAATVPSGNWHTTRDASSKLGRSQLENMLGKMIDEIEPIVVSRNVGLDLVTYDKEAGRKACLVKLADYLVTEHDVGLIVLEQRRLNEQAIDSLTITEAKQRGDIPPHVVAHQTSPSHENLLWLPDIVAGAMYRKMTGSNDRHYRLLHQRITTLEC